MFEGYFYGSSFTNAKVTVLYCAGDKWVRYWRIRVSELAICSSEWRCNFWGLAGSTVTGRTSLVGIYSATFKKAKASPMSPSVSEALFKKGQFFRGLLNTMRIILFYSQFNNKCIIFPTPCVLAYLRGGRALKENLLLLTRPYDISLTGHGIFNGEVYYCYYWILQASTWES